MNKYNTIIEVCSFRVTTTSIVNVPIKKLAMLLRHASSLLGIPLRASVATPPDVAKLCSNTQKLLRCSKHITPLIISLDGRELSRPKTRHYSSYKLDCCLKGKRTDSILRHRDMVGELSEQSTVLHCHTAASNV